MSRLKSFLNQVQRNIIANSFIYSNFNYCPLIWHFCSQRLTNKIENIQKRTLQFVLNDYISDKETLLNKQTNARKKFYYSDYRMSLWVLALAFFCSVNKLNHIYMQSLVGKNWNSKRYKDNLKVPIQNSVTFGDKSVVTV